MAVDERARHELSLRVEQEIGSEAAETLMEMLPPVGRTDVATKADLGIGLHHLEERMNLRLDSKLDEAEFHRAMHTQFRNLVVLCSTLVVAVAGIAFAAAGLH